MIDNSKEYIFCAAIWYYNDLKTDPEEQRGMVAQNINKGMIVGQWRHGNCIYVYATNHKFEDGAYNYKYNFKNHVDGFLTSRGKFVDRWQAAELAILAGQISEETGINKNWDGDEEYMKDFQNQVPHWRGGEERNKCKYRMMYSEDIY